MLVIPVPRTRNVQIISHTFYAEKDAKTSGSADAASMGRSRRFPWRRNCWIRLMRLFCAEMPGVTPAFWVAGAGKTHRDYQALVTLALFTPARTKTDAKNG